LAHGDPDQPFAPGPPDPDDVDVPASRSVAIMVRPGA
jgi:hypothetical protein